MTIFLDVAKIIIRDKIKAIQTASKESDASIFQTTLMRAQLGRDLGVSAAKRERLDSLSTQIASISDQTNDADTLTLLKQMVQDSLITVKEVASAAGYLRGNTESELERLCTILDTIYRALGILDICNIHRDTDPLNIFRYYAAIYFARKIVINESPTTVDVIKAHVKILSTTPFFSAQENLVITTLKECTRDVSALSSSHEGYTLSKKQFVLASIETLRRANERLISATLGRASFFATVLSPDDGILLECMDHAQLKINPVLTFSSDGASKITTVSESSDEPTTITAASGSK